MENKCPNIKIRLKDSSTSRHERGDWKKCQVKPA
jgi:hypothetical protein